MARRNFSQRRLGEGGKINYAEEVEATLFEAINPANSPEALTSGFLILPFPSDLRPAWFSARGNAPGSLFPGSVL